MVIERSFTYVLNIHSHLQHLSWHTSHFSLRYLAMKQSTGRIGFLPFPMSLTVKMYSVVQKSCHPLPLFQTVGAHVIWNRKLYDVGVTRLLGHSLYSLSWKNNQLTDSVVHSDHSWAILWIVLPPLSLSMPHNPKTS